MFGDKKIKIKDSERSLISETVSIEGTINVQAYRCYWFGKRPGLF